MSTNAESYSIVVLGAMNPAIHHPSWYRLVELIDTDEEEAAFQSKNSFSLPLLAQFETNDLKIVCQEGRWEVHSSREDRVDRMMDIAARVFDDLLKHTPVSAFGLNLNFRRKTQCESVARILASQLTNTALGLKQDNATGAELVLRREFEDHLAMTNVRAARNATFVSVSNNYHYDLQGQESYYSLRPRFDESWPSDRADALEQTQQIVNAINELGKG